MIKAMAVDIDGTLTNMTRRLSPVAVEAVYRLKVPMVLITGNTPCFTRAVAVMLGAENFVAENGGVISCSGDLELLADIVPCREAYEALHEVLGAEGYDSRYRMTDLVLKRGFDLAAASSLIESLGLPVELIDTGFAVHIKNKGVDKGTGLRRISEKMGIPLKDFAAVGDSISDLPMFQVAGFSAAVANSPPELKEAANFVAGEKFGEGFSEIVEYMTIRGLLQPFG